MFIVLEVFVITKEYVILHRFLRSCLHTWFRNEGLFGFFIERTIKSLWILRKCYYKLSFAYNHVCWQAAPYEKSIHLFERLVKLFVISAFFPFERFFSSLFCLSWSQLFQLLKKLYKSGGDNSLIKSSYFASKNLNIVPYDLHVSKCMFRSVKDQGTNHSHQRESASAKNRPFAWVDHVINFW